MKKNIENKSYTLDQALDFVLADDSVFEKLDSDPDYEDDILKKNENKNNGDQSDPDEEDEIPLNMQVQEATNQSEMLIHKSFKILE